MASPEPPDPFDVPGHSTYSRLAGTARARPAAVRERARVCRTHRATARGAPVGVPAVGGRAGSGGPAGGCGGRGGGGAVGGGEEGGGGAVGGWEARDDGGRGGVPEGEGRPSGGGVARGVSRHVGRGRPADPWGGCGSCQVGRG
ncbi:hypothetical protein SGPA1_21965 [Streptomyces misionensis JCM 4497]